MRGVLYTPLFAFANKKYHAPRPRIRSYWATCAAGV